MVKYSTDTVDVEFDGVYVRITVKEGAEFNLENSLIDRLALKELLGDDKAPILIDARKNFSVSPEGMDLAASEGGNYNRKAVAYFTSSVASRLRLSVFISSKKPSVPTKLFNTEEQALSWLLS